MGKVKIGFVGVGGMGQCAHLQNYMTVEDCEVVAIAEIREKTAARVAERYGIPTVYAEASDMLANEELDAIVASQPFNRHGILLPELLTAGKPIFIEKPLSSTIESGEKILEALEGSGTWIMVGYHKRSDPASMWAKAEIDRLKADGELGRMKYIRITMPVGDWVANGFLPLINEQDSAPQLAVEPPPSDMDEKAYGDYTAFVNYYIHQVNLMRYFLGESYSVSYADPQGVLLVGQSESGVTCTIEMDPFSTTVDWQEKVLVCFEHGWINVDLPAPLAHNRPGTVQLYSDPSAEQTPELRTPQLPWVHAMRQQAMNFVAAVKGECEPMCTAAEALEDLRVARQYLKHFRGV